MFYSSNIYIFYIRIIKMFLLLPLLYFLYLDYSCQIYAQNKQCTNCKYFIPYKNNKVSGLGLCKMFGNRVYTKENKNVIYNFAQHCRDDEKLCGKNATFYEESENITKEVPVKILDDEMKKMINEYYYYLRNNNW